MASIKIKLRTDRPKKDGTCPLVIQIIINRVRKRVPIGFSLYEKDWDARQNKVKKSHPNSTRFNNLLAKKLAEANDKLLEAETSEQHVTAQKLKQKVKRASQGILFFEQAAERIKTKHLKKVFSVARAERSILYNIQEFVNMTDSTTKAEIQARRKKRISEGRKKNFHFLEDVKLLAKSSTLKFEDINGMFLHDFKMFCAIYLDQRPRTITNQLIFIRTLFNLEIKNDSTLKKHYPFAGDGEKITIDESQKIGLTKQEVAKIEVLQLEPNSQIWHTRNVWLFSYYFAGIRVSDTVQLQWSDFKDGRLYYVMNKNQKPVSLKIPAKAQVILDQYQNRQFLTNGFVFPYLDHADVNNTEDVFVKSRNATSLLNDYLARIAKLCHIDKPLTNHISRHSFGNVSKDMINPYVLQKLYRHADLKTTIRYQANFIHKEADDALDAVVA